MHADKIVLFQSMSGVNVYKVFNIYCHHDLMMILLGRDNHRLQLCITYMLLS